MKKISILLVALSLLLTLCLNSCGTPPDNKDGEESVILSRRSITISDFNTPEPLTATVVGAKEENPLPTWKTSDDKVAIYENGHVVATGYGACVIRAEYNGATAACTVVVPSPNPELSLSVTSVTLADIGETTIATALDSSGFNVSSSVIWSTSNEKVAVCQNGIITARGYGSCIITAFYKGLGVDCAVEVTDPDAPALSLSVRDIEIPVGTTYHLSATLKNHTSQNIEWRSSDESIAVCENGTVTAVGGGVCAIIAISDEGATDACIIRAGGYIDPSYTSDMLRLQMPKIGKVMRFVNRINGQTVSKVIVTGCSLSAEPYNGDPYLLFIKLKFTCVKIYDAAGPNATSMISFGVEMYDDVNEMCQGQTFINGEMAVGDTMEFVFDDFGIGLSDGTCREFEVIFEEITES
ncbi:MAG: Ig-like domain-containing protein [Clostridia bacterium]|nr:Ig-like domain-containing protein [Clostridia bacterium]